MTLYGFFHTACVHESAAALVSLHRTKAGAWRAMWRYQWGRWEELRSGKDTNLHMGPAFHRRTAVYYDHSPLFGEASSVAAVEVLP
jgi:hypothetical protein